MYEEAANASRADQQLLHCLCPQFQKEMELRRIHACDLSCFAKKADGTFVPHKGTALYLKEDHRAAASCLSLRLSVV